MASEMMKNMKPEDMQNMMRTFQENPQMMAQAQRMMGGGGGFGGPGGFAAPSPAQPNPMDPIVALKNAGNELIRQKDYEKASVKYLEAILDIEDLRTRLTPPQTGSQKFLGDLNDLEISCRNNYCIAKTHLAEFGLILPQCERVLAIDHKNPKALFNSSLAHFNLRDFAKAAADMDRLVGLLGEHGLDAKIRDLKAKIEEKMAPPKAEPTAKAPETQASQTETRPMDTPSPPAPAKVSEPEPKQQKTEEKPAEAPKVVPPVPSNPLDVPPVHVPDSSPEPPKDFQFDQEDESEQIEALFQRQQKPTPPLSTTPPPTPAPAAHPHPPSKPTPTAQPPTDEVGPAQAFLNRYWQVLLGVLLGLLLAKLLGR